MGGAEGRESRNEIDLDHGPPALEIDLIGNEVQGLSDVPLTVIPLHQRNLCHLCFSRIQAKNRKSSG
jgi:hypothetical protein